MNFLRAICRFAFGLTFILSGFLKAIDPIGGALKIKEYFSAFHLGFLDFLSMPGSFLLSLAEFIIGVAILKGLKFKLFSKIALAFISFFTVLTLILAIFNPVTDCGCFGEAIILTNWQTFGKNVILLLMALLLYYQRDKFKPIATSRIEWGYLCCYMLIILGISLYAHKNMPQIDFGQYKPGTDLIASTAEQQEREYATTFIYSKDGKQQNFTLDNLPDSTWTFVDAKTVQVGERESQTSKDFALKDSLGNYVSVKLLEQRNPLFFISYYNTNEVSLKMAKNIARLYDTLKTHNAKLYFISGSSIETTNSFLANLKPLIDSYNIEVLYTDYKTAISLNRSNGGLTYVNGEIVIRKWPRSNYPIKNIHNILKKDPEIVMADEIIDEQIFAEICFGVIILLIVIIRFISKILYKRYLKKLKSIETI